MAEKDYGSSKVITKKKDRISDQKIGNCFPFWQKRKDEDEDGDENENGNEDGDEDENKVFKIPR